MYRVQKILSLLGILSRRDCESKIMLGLVKINNELAKIGSKVSIGDKITYEDKDYLITSELLEIDTKILIYHKPINEIVSLNDPQKRPSVFDNLPDVNGKWINIGRLDYNTSGLLLFTNNGELANKMMHPSSNIVRTYEVIIKGHINKKKYELVTNGVDIGHNETGKFINIKADRNQKDKFIVKLNTGKNREVRRVFNSINCKVISLKRIGYGNIELDSLAPQCFEFIETSRLSEYL